MAYTCSRCGQKFCVSHRHPESHDCVDLEAERKIRQIRRKADQSEPWFKDEFQLSNVGDAESQVAEGSDSSSGRWDSYGKQDQQQSKKLKKAAQRAEEKRTPDYEPTPDVAPDGSLVHPGDGEDEDESVSEDGNPVISTRQIQFLTVLAFAFLVFLTVYWYT